MNQNNPQLIRASVITVIIAGLLGAMSVMVEGIGVVSGKIFSICLSLIIFGITATISMVVTRKPQLKNLGIAGMLVSGIGFIIFLVTIIGEIDDEGLLKTAFTCFIASIALGHISLLHNFSLQNKYATYARIIATVAISLFSFLLIMRIFEPFAGISSIIYNQSTLKMLIASLVLDLAATLLVPLCNRLPGDKPAELSFTEEPSEPQEVNEVSGLE